MPQVSIITICLNNKAGLEKTIQSVVAQTFNDFEFIVIDGGSIDGSAELINTYREKIAYGISEKDSGVYNAMNKGIKKASAEYCLFLNSGDTLFDKTTLSKVFSSKHSEHILYGNMIIDFMNGTTRLGKMPPKLSFKHMMRDTLWHPVSFIKRKLFQDIGPYNEEFSIASDYDFFLRSVLVNKVSLCYLNQTIAVFAHDGMSSLASNQPKLQKERRKIQLQYFNEQMIEEALIVRTLEKINRKIKAWIH